MRWVDGHPPVPRLHVDHRAQHAGDAVTGELQMKIVREDHSAPQVNGFRWLLLVMLAIVLMAAAFGAGAATTWYLGPRVEGLFVSVPTTPEAGATTEPKSREELAGILWETWEILDREYLDPSALVPDDMIRGAAAGAVRSVDDPYTVFVDPLPASIMDQDMQGSFEGIGATVGMVDGRLTIQDLLPGSPALAAGLRQGDVILEADGMSLNGKDVIEAISLIRGPRGSVVRLLVEREGEPEAFIVPVTRDRVDLPTVEAHMLEGDVAYLRLTEFNAVADRRVRDALTDLLPQEPRGLVLDLRGNPGGYFQTAIDVATEFLVRDSVIVSEQQRGDDPQTFAAERTGLAAEIPLVVLVDAGSASASEIVAGAIRDHERGILVGETTFGKGSVQNVHTLSDGSSLRVTVAKYYLPDGDNLDGAGLVPDLQVSYTQEDAEAERDPQLDRAVAYLMEGE